MRDSKLLVAALALAVSGCSLLTTDYNDCTSNQECGTRFGPAYICNSEALCEASQPVARCSKTWPPSLFQDADDRIIFGSLIDNSVEAQVGRENAVQLAMEQIDDEGGAFGRRFGIVFCNIESNFEGDGLGRTEAAVASATYLATVLQVPAIIGPAASSDAQEVFLSIRNTETLVISPSATSTSLSDLDPLDVSDESPGLLWRTAPPDSLQGQAIAADMREPGAGRSSVVNSVAAIYEAGAYGQGLVNVFSSSFQGAGGSVALFPFESPGQLATRITEVGIGTHDEVLFISSQSSDAVNFFNAVATAPAYDDLEIFVTDGAANEADVLSVANPNRFPQVRGSRPAPLDESVDFVYATFLAAYSGAFGVDAKSLSFSANAYDAAWLIALGAAWVLAQEEQELSGPAIAQGLRQLSSGAEFDLIPTSWNAMLQAFASGAPVNVNGASGRLDYDPVTEETTTPIEIWTISGTSVERIDLWEP
tara:strand:+ start:100822 stop:102258 length:1437 start_codon:yes stop_codon:yes gene_type:complete